MIDRQKAFPNCRDGFSLVLDSSGIDSITRRAVAEGVESVTKTFEHENPFKRFPKFYRKTSPNFNDPITLYYVLDALYSTQPGTYIRVPYLVNYLNGSAPMYYWTVDLVGRMMAGLWETVMETYLDEEDEQGVEYIPSKRGSGEEIPKAKRLKWLPLALGRDAQGKYYVIDPDMTIEGRLWILRFRMIAGNLAYAAMVEERDGNLGYNQGKYNTPAGYYLSIAPDPIGSATYFRRRDMEAIQLKAHRTEIPDVDYWTEEDG